MKVTLYTTTNCQFSKQEKEYLTSHSLPFEEKNLDTNKEFLTEMMTVGNNFAGTPVTKIEKDDGTIVVLKGFTETEFNTALGFADPVKTEEVKPDAATAPQPMIKADDPASIPTVPAATPPVEDKPATPPPASAPQQTAPEPPLDDVLSKLQTNIEEAQKAVSSAGTVTPPATAPTPPAMPEVPTPPSETTPAIPDFPTDQGAQPAKA